MKAGRPAPPTLFLGCQPTVLADGGGRIIAVGPRARELAPPGARRVELEGRALPGLGDSHIHLDGLVQLRTGLQLHRTSSLGEVLEAVREASHSRPQGGWIVGRGWNYSRWPEARWPTRHDLDGAAGGRPVLLASKDEHSIWASSSALSAAGIGRGTPQPQGGVIEREPDGEPSGLVREAWDLFAGVFPGPGREEYDGLLAAVLAELAGLGLVTLHTMDPAETLFSLQRLRAAGRLVQRVVVNLPMARLEPAGQLGIRSGWGDSHLRIWGVKAFVDGSLGSRTAEMLDGSGVARIPDPELEELIRRCSEAELNLCLHAIGDGAVHRALLALERHRPDWPGWRPRIEHAQCVDPADLPRFLGAGAVASMQPFHAVSDREMADSVWGDRAAHAYAWGSLLRAGVPLAFGSDAPVESPDPLAGIRAATAWRQQAGWYPELAISKAAAVRAYSSGVAFAAGMEREWGRLQPGYRCDLTVVSRDRVVATVVDGVVIHGLALPAAS